MLRENAIVSSSPAVQIVGAGPAGASAAIAALHEAAAVRITDRARATRHKVCGEFLSAEVSSVLERLGVWPDFLESGPSRIHRCRLYFGWRVKEWTLSEPGFGLSRLALDRLLLGRACSLGAGLARGLDIRGDSENGSALVLANGRHPSASPGPRLFGFKAHFEGPCDDAVELYFDRFGYVGVNSVEGNRTNVCGIAPEDVLRRHGFEIDEFLSHSSPLAERLRPLTRRMAWLMTGPLTFSRFRTVPTDSYPAGDALGFVDPFTGSGILNALATGSLAGEAAARRTPPAEYFQSCRILLKRPIAVSALLRAAIRSGLAGQLAWLVPGEWMYRLTRYAKS